MAMQAPQGFAQPPAEQLAPPPAQPPAQEPAPPPAQSLAPPPAPGLAPPPAPPLAPPPAPVLKWAMSTAANLSQLLPTGTVLAYEALSPIFTKHDKCEHFDRVFARVVVGVLGGMCGLFSFTDSVIGLRDGKLYYGVATPCGFKVFNFADQDERQALGNLDDFKRLRIRLLDVVHASFAVAVFLAVAFSDVGGQNCLLPDASMEKQELLKKLLLAIAPLCTVVFTIFPTKRKGIGFNETVTRRMVNLTN